MVLNRKVDGTKTERWQLIRTLELGSFWFAEGFRSQRINRDLCMNFYGSFLVLQICVLQENDCPAFGTIGPKIKTENWGLPELIWFNVEKLHTLNFMEDNQVLGRLLVRDYLKVFEDA